VTTKSGLEVGGALLCLVAAILFLASVVDRRLETVASGEVLVPTPTQPGVTVVAGPGRSLLVDSTPEGAEVFLDGAAHGQTPLSEDFTCSDGQKVSLEVKLKGFSSRKFSLGCVTGTTKVLAELRARK
jgi:hypothetical protein